MRTNKYATTCITCTTDVAAGTGALTKAADGWIVRCAACNALTPEASRTTQAQAETDYLDSRGFDMTDPDKVLHAALIEGGFKNPVSVTLPAPTATKPRRPSTSRRRRACVTGGNCSSFGNGGSCGGHDCDGH